MRVLLVTPRFRGYWRSYTTALEELGHTVDTVLYDDFDGTRDVVRNKLLGELPARLGREVGVRRQNNRHTRRALAAAARTDADVALVVKGDSLLPPFWDALDRRGIPAVLYVYDDLRRMQHTPDSLRRARHVATYSRPDFEQLQADGYSVSYVPLFYDPALRYVAVPEEAVVFVGARYPQREELLLRLHERGIPIVAYGRDWSHRPLDRLRSLDLRRPALPGRPDVTLAQSYGLAAGAAAAVNIHGGFSGVNSRTFEICGVGGLQLVDRPDIGDLYDLGTEVVTYETPEELEEQAGRAMTDRPWARSIREAGRRRTLAEHTCGHRVRALVQGW